ncbi:preprotein translocase subunit SecB [Stutzerimonas stutzeri]|uniref:protein-export chaperone SecB n=1 Tax=Stutzerimonas stutzeri TaxID=316 RepID=UPI000F7ABFA6|nr:protein-export chaperone SecB [Stutzerimonas stutzeri]RRV35645.1 preprotein translocase subunit SecB [Stutzerimonas stutzeri]RRV87015.1 preprotein translocase subunit SecB [Stutzerimonas stutzeri]RRV96979.1 preprotein translocase subunit SecB [Stutzerimonas stutzeri]RRV99177.1 preprotein translocase subunit SecB [Stutzerimonas stutzeri]RRW01487.1 preprotein translocase subunit SecB [Stutzerimonas stutzeri]
MKINIAGTKVLRLLITDFEPIEKNGDSEDQAPAAGKATFSVKVDFDTERFFVTFDLTLITEENKTINVIYASEFRTDHRIDDDFKKGNFPYINAPAIAYPFLRAFISNLTLNCGYAAIMLPSVNFVELKDRIEKPEGL